MNNTPENKAEIPEDGRAAELLQRRNTLLEAIDEKRREISSAGRWTGIFTSVFLSVAFIVFFILEYPSYHDEETAILVMLASGVFICIGTDILLRGFPRFLVFYLTPPALGLAMFLYSNFERAPIDLEVFLGFLVLMLLYFPFTWIVFGPASASLTRRRFPFTKFAIRFSQVTGFFWLGIAGLLAWYYFIVFSYLGSEEVIIYLIASIAFFLLILTGVLFSVLNLSSNNHEQSRKTANISLALIGSGFFLQTGLILLSSYIETYRTEEFLITVAIICSIIAYAIICLSGLTGLLFEISLASWRKKVLMEVKRIEIEVNDTVDPRHRP